MTGWADGDITLELNGMPITFEKKEVAQTRLMPPLLIRLGGITVAKRVTKKVNSTELDSKEFLPPSPRSRRRRASKRAI